MTSTASGASARWLTILLAGTLWGACVGLVSGITLIIGVLIVAQGDQYAVDAGDLLALSAVFGALAGSVTGFVAAGCAVVIRALVARRSRRVRMVADVLAVILACAVALSCVWFLFDSAFGTNSPSAWVGYGGAVLGVTAYAVMLIRERRRA